MIIYIDIDNTICSSIGNKTAKNKIKYCKPYLNMIKLINDLHDAGNFIIFYTHRASCCERQTVLWLKKHKVKYDDIKFDKPGYDLLIDDKALPPTRYLTSKYLEEYKDTIQRWHFGKGKFRTK